MNEFYEIDEELSVTLVSKKKKIWPVTPEICSNKTNKQPFNLMN